MRYRRDVFSTTALLRVTRAEDGSATTPLKPKEGLNGPPSGFCCWYSEQCHSSLDLPQASWLLGMTKGRVALPFGVTVVMTTSQHLRAAREQYLALPAKSVRWGFRPIVFVPRTLWRTWGTPPEGWAVTILLWRTVYLADFSTCPPNSKRMAESSLSAKSASPRELKRS
jgi:hypothetical protein